MYYIYMLSCEGNTIYTGTAADIDKRMKQHFSASRECAKFTRSHPPLRLEALWSCESKGEALRTEVRIKRLTRSQKLSLIGGGELSSLCPDAPQCTRIYDEELMGRWKRVD